MPTKDREWSGSRLRTTPYLLAGVDIVTYISGFLRFTARPETSPLYHSFGVLV